MDFRSVGYFLDDTLYRRFHRLHVFDDKDGVVNRLPECSLLDLAVGAVAACR
jgi:hypothetical protein